MSSLAANIIWLNLIGKLLHIVVISAMGYYISSFIVHLKNLRRFETTASMVKFASFMRPGLLSFIDEFMKDSAIYNLLLITETRYGDKAKVRAGAFSQGRVVGCFWRWRINLGDSFNAYTDVVR